VSVSGLPVVIGAPAEWVYVLSPHRARGAAAGSLHKDPTGREWQKRYSAIEYVPSPHIGGS
jgi:hypothetical protein